MSPTPEIVTDYRRLRRSFLLQALAAGVLGVVLPAAAYFLPEPTLLVTNASARNSIIGALAAVVCGVFLSRKVNGFPGAKHFGSVFPSFTLSFGLVAAYILITRIDYSIAVLTMSYVLSLAVHLSTMLMVSKSEGSVFFTVPGGRIDCLSDYGIASHLLLQPGIPAERGAILVADLHHDFEPEWEKMLAHAALSGIPVFHYKQICEAATGKVRIEHLSENSFGSLLPNMSYVRAKRLVDILLVLALSPILLLPLLLVALAIRSETPGPALFRQKRIGYRGKPFHVIKFRTMHVRAEASDEGACSDAMTKENDQRITPLGRFLRRTRIDELPQMINILRGEMSWIGPRPEAIALARWYEMEIPFYAYRHIVRPGISGWAQVNQGHVTQLGEVDDKLQYDFYYIMNFSYWLDILILLKTIRIVLSGYGAR